MHSAFLKTCIFVLLFLLFSVQGFAQGLSDYKRLEAKIDSLANIGLPKSALLEIDKLDKHARKHNNVPQQIKAVLYRMNFQSYLEENALEKIINRLKLDIEQSVYPVKPVLQSVLAEIYWNYYLQNRWQFSQRTSLEKPDADYTRWDLKTIVNEVGNLYKRSLADASHQQRTPLNVLNGVLLGDSATRYLRPTLYDLMAHRALSFFLHEEPSLLQPKMPFSLNSADLFAGNHGFVNAMVLASDTLSISYQGVKLLQKVTKFHLEQPESEALADINIIRLEYLFRKSVHPEKDSLYLQGLRTVATTFSDKPISAEALVKIGQYFKQKDSLKIAKHYLDKAIQTFPNSIAAKNAENLIKDISRKEVSVTIESVNLPEKPVLVLLNYRNINKVQYRLYKLSEKQLKSIAKFDKYDKGWRDKRVQPSDSLLIYLKQQSVFKGAGLDVINPADFKSHSTEFALPPLAPGHYLLLTKDALSDEKSLTNLVEFKVSALAYATRINPSGELEVRVLNRETGAALSKVNVTVQEVQYSNRESNGVKLGSGITDREGKFALSAVKAQGKQVVVSLSVPGDVFTDDQFYAHGELIQKPSNEETLRTILFTDRQIYRPGQTIYFKGIQLLHSKAKSEIVAEQMIEVDLSDANDKEITVLKLKTNEFGTFTGSFIIPQNTLNGRFTIATDDGRLEVNVEEYKRPTFEVVLQPVTESYRLNDSVSVKGMVTAFSDYGVSNAIVAYRITRKRADYRDYRYGYSTNSAEILTDTARTNNSGEFTIRFKALPEDRIPQRDQIYSYLISVDVTDASAETRSSSTTVAIGEKTFLINLPLPKKLPTNELLVGVLENFKKIGNGPLLIIDGIPSSRDFNDISPKDIEKLEILKDASQTAIYGSQGASGVILLTTKGGKANGSGSYTIPVSLTNLNNQKLDGTIKVTVYSLKSPERTFVNRLWNAPNYPSLSKDNFHKLFPYYEYKSDADETTWPVNKRIAGLDIVVSAAKANFLDLSFLKNMESGRYKIELFATNAKGDTLTSNRHTYLVGEPAKQVKVQDWVLPIKTNLLPGQNAEFLVGLGESSNILMETYNGSELLSSKWLRIGNKQELLKVPVAKNHSYFRVQFLTSFQNRQLSSDHSVNFIKPDDKMNIRFVTFRDKLQPGEKEQWKLQISGDGKQGAEMLASLYDASLDDILAPADWNHGLKRGDSYTSNYYEWMQNRSSVPVNSLAFGYFNHYFSMISRSYERLDFMGYQYYGGYNPGYQNYLRRVNAKAESVKLEKKFQEEYVRNAGLVKKGFDVSGKVVDRTGESLPGVQIKIKGTKIVAHTNIDGYFKLKAPINAVLVFSYIGFKTHEFKAQKQINVDVVLDEARGGELNEVVVVGYGVQKKATSTGAQTSLRENGSLSGRLGADQGNIRIRGVATQEVRLESAAPTVSPKSIPLRKNFNETAFFYPQLRTNAKGEILIEFTIPEALTRWRFKGFAHTKTLQTGYIEKEIVTQKSLMISANMPRFFREGDTIAIAARLANLTDKSIKGKAELQLFNALTMQPVQLLANSAQATQKFELDASNNKAVSFKLIIPKGLDAIAYRLTADGGQYTDGEENTIPVLPNSMLVTESMPMMVRAGQTKMFTLNKLVNNVSTTLQHKTYTVEYTQNPVWYAVQALPYLMEYPYECSEQIFSRYYANSLAGTIVQRLPKIKAVFEQWKSTSSAQLLSNLEKNQELKSILIEETPWLRDAANETEQKKRVALLFDLNKMNNELALNLDKLANMQRMDGGFPWFSGSNYSDRYITQHILAGFGQLAKLTDAKSGKPFNEITKRGLRYLDKEIIEDYKDALRDEKRNKVKSESISSLTLHAVYVRSYYLDQTQSADLKLAINYFLPKIIATWKFKSVYEQGLMAFVSQRCGRPEAAKAIIRSLKETAQQSDELGMYWAKNRVGYYWYQSPVETQALLIELFSEIGNEPKSVEEMKIWLLRNKQTTNWKTTKATALACYSLLLRGENWVETTATSELKLGGQQLAVLKPELKADAGTGYIKTSWRNEQIKPEMGTIEVQNSGKVINWGAAYWQYLEQMDKISTAETQLKLERKYFIQKQTDAGARLYEVNASQQAKTGDILKVVVYLNADRDYEYIHLKDMRPSGTEPSDVLSGYKYQERFYYYQVTKDVATNFFINYLPKGKYVFEYSLRVVQPGNFSTGISSIQCLYAPEFGAHSAGGRIVFK